MSRTSTPMTVFAAARAKQAFGQLLDTAQREPVTITKKSRPVAVVLSKHAYDAMARELAELRSARETDHLLSTEANRERLAAAATPRGERVVKTLEELQARED